MQGLSLELPSGYYLERDPDVLILRRLDGSMIGAFSARGAAPEAVMRAIEESAGPETPDARSSAVQARLFGHFELLCDGEVVHLGRNGKALAILKYLLAHRTRPVSQDHLMGWLWPESNLKKARWSLNSAIHSLRKLLGSCPSSALVNYILLEEGYYRLSPAVEVGADMLNRLAVHYMESGQLRASARACYRVLEKDRCHEDSYRLLMECYVRLGLRGRALRQYKLCERVLRQEYGTAPSQETRALYGSILREEGT